MEAPTSILYPPDGGFPLSLKEIYKPPAQLYVQGDISITTAPCLSIIGSRRMTTYGERVLTQFIPALVQAGLTIVSGLAYGVDACAHRLALAQGGRCVAVLGSGFNHVYPPSNTALYRHILENGGCVLSEYAPDTSPQKFFFPERNRIVAGLSSVVLIIEAGEHSGTLITARQAIDSGRTVCVVPADIYRPEYQGIHYLFKQGAHPVATPGEILEHFQLPLPLLSPGMFKPALTGSLATLYDLILRGTETIEDILTQSGWDIGQLQSLLSVLELDGYIKRNGQQWLTTS